MKDFLRRLFLPYKVIRLLEKENGFLNIKVACLEETTKIDLDQNQRLLESLAGNVDVRINLERLSVAFLDIVEDLEEFNTQYGDEVISVKYNMGDSLIKHGEIIETVRSGKWRLN